MVVGQDQKFLGALVVVDQKAVELYLKDSAVPYEARATMLDMPEVLELINGEIFYASEHLDDLLRSDSAAGSLGPSFRWNILNLHQSDIGFSY